ncbi:PAS domain-containing protein [Actomonas aquatica]|uniref:PAS domain-containing protein n=1 Tax=Actomonas aquatica TaxID=2866162 RepID=A0ABZ1C4C4_9BACT|nr:PAS domain-containing protein [Opitutus sp. WL0086]WRQ86225.1 PAS domain-containing protein [Opitutus sp. WL0086]
MARPKIQPTGEEVTFSPDEVIVSKTDPRGVITYANAVFQRVSGYTEAELLGQPHNLIRHPDMPACVFKLLWDVVQSGQEIFAYVNNLAKDGRNYWVFAHVTPSCDASGRIVAYHSNRRVPHPDALAKVKPLYRTLLEAERAAGGGAAGMAASLALVEKTLAAAGQSYGEFVFSLSAETSLAASL